MPVVTKPINAATQAQMAAAVERAKRILAKRYFYEFVKQAWGVVEPDHAFEDNWHIKALSEHLQAVHEGKIENIILNVPPGTMKSLLVCVFFPAWVWIHSPGKRFMSGSYAEPLAMRDAVKARDLLLSEWYQARWPIALRQDVNAKGRYENSQGGWRLVCSVGGRGIGEHPDFLLIDDPHNVVDMESEAERQAVVNWLDGMVSSRGVTRGVRRVLVMQRLHTQDASGYLLEKRDSTGKQIWEHICLPMRYEMATKDEKTQEMVPRMRPTSLGFSDPRKEDGELLWPRLYTENRVSLMEINMGPYHAAGQLQQRPTPRGGGKFKRNWFEVLPNLPPLIQSVRFWDKAGCLISGTLVDTIEGQRPIESIRQGDLVRTRNGFREVEWAGLTGVKDTLVSVLFSNGAIVTGTPDHPVLVNGRYWFPLATINGRHYVTAWEEKETQTLRQSSSMVCVTHGNQDSGILSHGLGTKIKGSMWPIPSTGRFGGTLMGVFPMARIFTTRMKIGITTRFQILCALPGVSIDSFTRRTTLLDGRITGAQRSIARIYGSFLKDKRNIKGLNEPGMMHNGEGLSHGLGFLSRILSVLFVQSNSNTALLESRFTVLSAGIRNTTHGAPVYNLTVKDVPEFFANGILVHNTKGGLGARTAGVFIAAYNDTGVPANSPFFRKYIIIDAQGHRVEAAEREQIIKNQAVSDRAVHSSVVTWVEQEPGSGGKESAKGTIANLVGFAVMADKVTGSKEVRADPLASQASVGKVKILAGNWNKEFLDEVELFPLGKLKDLVDAAGGGFNKLFQPTAFTDASWVRTSSVDEGREWFEPDRLDL